MATTTWFACVPRALRASRALTQPDMGCPAEVLDDGRWRFEPQVQVTTDVRWIAIRPGPFGQGASGMGVASCGARTLPAPLTAGIC